MFKYTCTLLLMLILLTSCAGQVAEIAITAEPQRTDFPSMADIQKVRPGMSYESINDLLGAPYKYTSDNNVLEINYMLENNAEYTVFLEDNNDGIAYVTGTSLYRNPETEENTLSSEFNYSKWKFIWPGVDKACEINLGLTADRVEELLGAPQNRKGFGAIREVYYLRGGYSAEIYYFSDDTSEPVVGRIDIKPLSWSENTDYYLLSAANIIIPLLVAIIILFFALRAYRIKRNKIK